MTPRSRPPLLRRAGRRAPAAALVLVATLCLALVARSPARADASTPVDPDHGPPAAARFAAPDAAREAVPAAALEVAGVPDVIGGDDKRVFSSAWIATDRRAALAVASDGTLFAAVAMESATLGWIYVYHSTDHGNTWDNWGGLTGVAGSYCDQPAIRVAEGDQDRVYVAYRYRASMAADADIRVAWSPLGTSASWTNVIALSQAGVTFERPSLDSDAVNYATYALYLAAAAQDGDGRDVWFTRSADFGATWAAGYRIATMTIAARDYSLPEVRYGWGGNVHCVWQFECRDGGADDAVRYRRATNRAAGGLADWEPIRYVTSNTDGRTEYHPSVAASYANMWTVVSFGTKRPDGLLHGTVFRASPDAGASWGAAYEDSLHGTYYVGIKALPDVEGFIGAGQTAFGEIGVTRASNGLPLQWSPIQNLNDRGYNDGWSDSRTLSFDYDPSMGDRVGAIWPRCVAGSGADTLFFDAEWCRDPGWPNHEAGSPFPLVSAPVSAPAVAELDGDPQSEIVFTDVAGNVQALNHDGTGVPGWPQSAVSVAADAAVAVGDLDGDGRNEVVAGSSTGKVYAWRHDGTPLAGWPVDLGFGAASVFVSLGALLSESPLQVVATSGTHEFVIRLNGLTAPGWPSYKSAAFNAPAAIGDVDGDGTNEVVALFGPYMNVQSPTGTVEHYRNLIAAGQTFSGAPALGDLDLDGNLEIVAPTAQGDLYAFRFDGTDQVGFPWSDPTPYALTTAALGNIWSMGEPEIAVATRYADDPHVHLLDHHGVSIGTWPRHTVDLGGFANPPIIDVIEQTPASHYWTVLTTDSDQYGYAWSNLGPALDGWPRDLGAPSPVTPASGDLDADGRLEVVTLTSSPARMQIVDLGSTVYRSTGMPRSWWPMLGYNPERQGCLACAPFAVVTVPPSLPGLPAQVRFEAPAPNPAHGSVSLRFALPGRAAVSLDVFDVSGRLVRPLLRTELEAGWHEQAWDGRLGGGERAAAGVYYVRLAYAGPAGADALVRRVVRLP